MRKAISTLGTLGVFSASLMAGQSQAQSMDFDVNLLSNPGFETSDATGLGNNIGATTPGWFIGGGAPPNVVIVDGDGPFVYERARDNRPFGPQFDAQNNGTGAGGNALQRYLDIVGGTNSVFQTFSTPSCAVAPNAPITWTVSGWISGRDEATNGFGELRIRLGAGLDGPLILSTDGGSPRVEITSPADSSRWTEVVAQYVLDQNTTYTFEVFLQNNANFDEGSVVQNAFVCPDIEAEKSVSSVQDANGNGIFGDVGDTVVYEFFIENTGTAALANLSVSDEGPTNATGAFTLSQPAPGFDGTLAPGEGPVLVATAEYVLTLDDVLNGDLSNTATVSAQPVALDANGDPDPNAPLPGFPVFTEGTDTGSDPVIDQNDGSTPTIADPTGTDSDGVAGNDANEPTALSLPPLAPELTLEKAADTSGLSTPVVAGDQITFTFSVTNVGNIDLDQDDTLPIDTLTYGPDGSGGPVATPIVITRAASSSDNNDGILQQGEVITYQGVFTLDQLAIDSGGVSNTASSQATAVDPAGNPLAGVPPVTATSDNDAGADGADGPADGNGNNPTSVTIPTEASLSVIKSAAAVFSTPPAVDDVVTFTYVVTNDGDVTVFNVGVTETPAGFTGTGVLPAPVLQSGGTNEDGGVGTLDLLPGATITFTADYRITGPDLVAGVLGNSAQASGPDLDGNTVSDTSDAGSDAAGDPINNPEGQETADSAGNTDGDLTNDPTVFDIMSPPVAAPDAITAPTPGAPATLPTVVANDTDIDGTPQPDRVSFVAPAGATTVTDADGDVTSVTVDGEGTWSVDELGNVTFTPEAGFEGDPTPIQYTVLDDDGLVSEPALLSVDYEQLPAISVLKTADLSGVQSPPQVGDEIVYSYVVSNDGNVTLFDVSVDDPDTNFTGTGALPVPTFLSGGADLDLELDGNDLAPGTDTITFSATYALTQLDIDAGGVTNQASATGDNVTGTPVMDQSDDPNALVDGGDADPTVTPLNQVSSISVIKSFATANDANGDNVLGNFNGTGDVITFEFLVRNTGNTTLTNVQVTDANPAVSVAGGPLTLAPGAADNTTFVGTYTITAADQVALFFENTASVSALDLNAVAVDDISDAGTDRNGEEILNPEDVDSPDGANGVDGITDNDPTVIRIPVEVVPGIEIVKSITRVVDTNGNGAIDATDLVEYAFAVRNTGNVELRNVMVRDPLFAVSGGPITLAIGASDETTFTGSYALVAANVTDGFVENRAEAVGEAFNALGQPVLDPATGDRLQTRDDSDSDTAPALGADGNPVAVANASANETPDGEGATDGDPGNDPTVLFVPSPSISVIKSISTVADSNNDGVIGNVGDTIGYSFRVENTGNVRLEGVSVTDLTATVSGGPITLDPTDFNDTAITATRVILADDLTVGFVENTATAAGAAVAPDGTPLFAPGGTRLTATDVSDAGSDAQGDPVANPEANETADGNGQTDGLTDNDPTVFDILAAPVAVDDSVAGLTPGDTAPLPLITDNDSDADGGLQADTVSFIVPDGAAGTVVDGDVVSVVVPGEGTWSVDELGNVTFTPEAGFEGDPTPITYTVADVDGLRSNPATLSVDYDQLPAIALEKTAVAALSDPVAVGDVITYSFVVTNTGNVSLFDVTVAETQFTGTGTAPVAGGETITTNLSGVSADAAADASVDTLGVGDSATFTATYALTLADINAGTVDNQASAAGDNVTGTPVTDLSDDPNALADGGDADPTVVALGQAPALTLVKSASAALSTPPAVGDIISYTFDVSNTGNVTVFNVDVSELAFTGAGAALVPAFASGGSDEDGIGTVDLLPGVTARFTASYALVAADLTAGQLDNSAQASGTDPAGNPVLDTSDTGTARNGDVIGDPAADAGVDDPTILDLLSPPVAEPDSVAGVTPGDAASLPLITANDTDVDGTPQPDRVSFVAPAGATTVTDADGDVTSVTVDGEGTWSVDDLGNVTFTPEAGFEGDPTPIQYTVLDDDGLVSEPALLSVDYEQLPAISVLKTADLSGVQSPPQVGDEIVYSYVVSNDGNVTLFDVSVDEQQGANFTGTGALPVPTFLSGGADLDLELDGNDLAPGTDTITFSATYALTQVDIDAGGVTNQASATGANVTGTPVTDQSDDPNALVDGGDADPTVTPLNQTPAIELVKVVLSAPDSNGDGLFGGEGDTVFYGFTVINTGNVTLSDISVSDLLIPVTGGPISLAGGAADDATFRGQLIVGSDDIVRGFIENTATVTGEDVNGAPVSDVSDTGTDPNADDIPDADTVESGDGFVATDDDPTNDPTVLTVPANPNPGLTLVKSISAVVDLNANGLTDAGDRIDYVFSVTNSGNLRLSNITVTDLLLTVSGTIATLEVLETNATDLTGSYVIAPGDVTTGFVENTAEATGDAVNSQGDPIIDLATGNQFSAADTSDSGTAPDLDANGDPITVATPGTAETPNGDGSTDGVAGNDPTVLRIPQPQLELIKTVFDVADTNNDGLIGGPNDLITYAFSVTNTGTVDLVNIMVDDELAQVTGDPIALLRVGQTNTTTFRATYSVTPTDFTNGFVQNTATATGTAVDETGTPFFGPGGDPVEVTDISDTGSASNGTPVTNPGGVETVGPNGNGDGDTTNDPTVITVPANPEAGLVLVKSAVSTQDTNNDAVAGGFGDLLTYSFAVTNTGNFPLSDVVVTDPRLGGAIGTIPFLRVDQTLSVTFDYEITFDDFTAGVIENTATASGALTNAAGTPILDPATGNPITATDVSDTGTDSDLAPVNNPGGVETPDANGGGNNDPSDDPTVTNIPFTPSGAAVSGIFFVDNNANDAFEPGIDEVVGGIIVNLRNAAGQIVGTAVTNADGFYEITGFPVGANFTVEFTDPANGNVLSSLTGLSFGPNTSLPNQNGLTAAPGGGALVMSKTSTRNTVILGDSVPYAITLTNNGTGPVPAVDVVDTLPVGLAFIQGTAAVDGTAVTPTQQGRTLTIPNVFVAAGGTVEITLFATVLPNAPFGDLTNVAQAVDPATGAVLASASATVERLPEAVFDCSDVIGKVFDDRNFNGYQDPIPKGGERTGALTNENIFEGKGAILSDNRPRLEGEPGLPGVRLLTATGTQITTDEYGRFSVPCAELAGPIGTNFTLKLDPKSLPTGYRVTTENPRTMRLTAGIATEMNFGATLGRVLDVDLTAAAFNGNVPVDRLDQGLAQLLRQVASTPSVVRISYFSNGEDTRTARARIKAVEDLIKDRWRDIGRYRLIVETTIKRLQ